MDRNGLGTSERIVGLVVAQSNSGILENPPSIAETFCVLVMVGDAGEVILVKSS